MKEKSLLRIWFFRLLASYNNNHIITWQTHTPPLLLRFQNEKLQFLQHPCEITGKQVK